MATAKVKVGVAKDDPNAVKGDTGRHNVDHTTTSINRGSAEEFTEGRWVKVILKDGKIAHLQHSP
ncbi:hypothetical protein [Limnoglobus roseus]|uniref:Uncharacterized protein n=1 Tax=Limnoglobus roseus TaxID=2598579 RepID=A0A5C1AFJ9_9BACT|nr:hypothetical protein [Limnoglobus roseus]QEL17590.1 hypothetical protein PX52LOC_04586 [Limnoglobus roseus]